jgi:hypothetical protein
MKELNGMIWEHPQKQITKSNAQRFIKDENDRRRKQLNHCCTWKIGGF